MGTVVKFSGPRQSTGFRLGASNKVKRKRLEREGFVLLGAVVIVFTLIFRDHDQSFGATAFGYCDGGHAANCVIDGDTFRLDGENIRIADIDAPETHPARCDKEAALGAQATSRLLQLLNQGPFDLRSGVRDEDRYGRKLRAVLRDGNSLGSQLVGEGLARPWTGSRRPWCPG